MRSYCWAFSYIIMATYLQLVKVLTFLYSIYNVGAAGDSNIDLDFGDEDMLLNMASTFLRGAADSNGDCTYKCPNGKLTKVGLKILFFIGPRGDLSCLKRLEFRSSLGSFKHIAFNQ